jgi:hypothetical protein
MKWIDIERPGKFGKNRDKIISGYNNRFGEENWRIIHLQISI